MSVHWGGKGPGHVSRWPRGVGAISPYSGATMLLDFLNPVLDPRITFSRGTNATLIDSTGRLTYAPNNLLTWSEDFSNAAWSKGAGVTVTADAGVAPNGTSTADNIAFSTGGVTQFVRGFPAVALTVGVSYIVSVYARLISGTPTFTFDVGNIIGSTTQTPTASWQRFSFAFTFSGANSWVDLEASAAGTIAFWGAQLEAVTYQTTPSTYVATTASAYYGPRFDYDPVTLAPRGLLIEEARTNLVLRSEEFNNTSAWGVIGISVTANTTVAPSGETTADTITSTSTTGVVIFPAGAGVSASATSYTASCYVKPGSAAWIVLSLWQGSGTLGVNAWFNAQTGAVGSNNATAGYAFTSASSTAVGNGWYRITVTGTVPAAALFWSLRLVDGDNAFVYTNTVGDTMFLYGAQLEAGSFATSYIPTVASTVTRNADVATMTGTNFSSWYNQSEGTFVYNATALAENTLTGVWIVNVSTGSNANVMYSAFADTRQLRGFDGSGVEQVAIASSPVTALQYAKVAAAYKLNDFAVSANGATVATDTSGTVAAPIQMIIGGGGGLNGWIAQIAYFNTRLPNAQLQTLTAPSLATTLSLDFTSGSYNVGF